MYVPGCAPKKLKYIIPGSMTQRNSMDSPRPKTPAYQRLRMKAPAYQRLRMKTPAYQRLRMKAPAYRRIRMKTPAYRRLRMIGAVGLWIAGSGPLFAHGGARGLVMLLPTGYYQVGAALAVAASFAVLLGLPRRVLGRLRAPARPGFHPPSRWPGWLSFALLGVLLSAGYFGSTDPLANPLPLFVWTLWWAGFTLLQCVLGDLWPLLNPWSAPLAALRALLPRLPASGAFRKPLRAFRKPLRALGYTPALVLFAGFAWFELVHPAPDNPARLAWVVLGYWAFTLVACVVFGEKYWLRRAEPFSVFFRLVGSCSPFVKRGGGQSTPGCKSGSKSGRWCMPGAKLASLAPLPLSGVLFVLLTLSSVSFDGLNKTFAWLDLLGVNPLVFPGRSALIAGNTVGLLLAFVVLAAVYFLCVGLGCRVAGRPDSFSHACGRLVYSLIPVSLVFHFAHYLPAILVNGQYALLAFNDPFDLGWNLLAAQNHSVTTSFLTHLPSVTLLWRLQTAVIVFGHIIGVSVAHLIAVALFGSLKTAAASQLFLAALMVAYTLFGLWLLSTPAIA